MQQHLKFNSVSTYILIIPVNYEFTNLVTSEIYYFSVFTVQTLRKFLQSYYFSIFAVNSKEVFAVNTYRKLFWCVSFQAEEETRRNQLMRDMAQLRLQVRFLSHIYDRVMQ